MTRLVVASGNAHKVAELRFTLADGAPGVDVLGLCDLPGPMPTIEETASTFAGNARLKAEGVAAWLRGQGEPPDTVVLADDSGLCVDALGGAPGVHSARFAGEDASDADNNRRLMAELERHGVHESPGHYVCVLALVRVDGGPVFGNQAAALFEGRWDVMVRRIARGDGGFGYDPHAWLDDRTVAELSPADKRSRSHRGRALRGLLERMRDGM